MSVGDSARPTEPGVDLEKRDHSDVVLDGEVIEREQRQTVYGRIIRPRADAVVTYLGATGTTAVVDRAWRRAVRVGWTTGQGVKSGGRRAWRGMTHGVEREQVRLAELSGDREAVGQAAKDLREAKTQRMRRLLELPRAVLGLAALAAGGLALLLVLLFVGAVVAQLAPGGTDWTGWWAGVGSVLAVLSTVLHFLVVVLVPVLAVPALLRAAWLEGKRVATLPLWLLAKDERNVETVIVTPAGVAEALAHLGIGPLNKAIKDGWKVEFSTPPVRVNDRGYYYVHSIPFGVTPEMIADKRELYARNLVRAPLEVWPTAAERAGWVEVWVADQGATERPAPEYPLLHEGKADVFAGVPLGVSQRGDVISPPLPGANLVFGGLMGQGKSNAARVTMAGAALDPIAELWVYVFAGNGDFDSYRPRLARYERGVEDSVAAAAIGSLRELYADVARRERRLADLGAKKVTRPLALQNPDLRPVIALFSECHELFGHEEYGKEAADLAVQILRRARKTAISLAFDTQSSRADAIPPKIVELVKLNACFAVKTWRSNDGFLGDGSFQAGIRATELRPGKDVGTSVLTGATSERFEIIKWFYIEVDDDTGFDAAADLIARSMKKVHPAVAVGGQTAEPELERDLLVDLDEVLGHEPLPISDVASLLHAHAPRWQPYRSLTGKALRERLAREHGVKVPSTNNRWPLNPQSVRDALARRGESEVSLRDDQ